MPALLWRQWLRRCWMTLAERERPVWRKPRRRARPQLEELEDRFAPATLTVNSFLDNTTADDSLVTLREAILAVTNSTTDDLGQTGTGNDTITFDATVFHTHQTIALTLGQLELTSGTVTITGPTAPGAGVTINGGGLSRVLQVDEGVTASISGLTIAGGKTIGYGGGLYNNGGTTTLTNCTVSGNSAVNGGGVANRGGPATLINCTLYGNTANGNGGGVYSSGTSTTKLTSCTVSGNTASQGGGLYDSVDSGPTTTVGNTIVAGNTAATGPDAAGVFNSKSHNLIGKTDGSSGWITFFFNGDDRGTIATPLDPLLGKLQDNGGPTQTMALLKISPALNSGSIALLPVGVTTDQRGDARISGPGLDIGAFEYQYIESLVVTTAADEDDGTSDANTGTGTSLREAIIFAKLLGGDQTITFDRTVFATPQTITLSVGAFHNFELKLQNPFHSPPQIQNAKLTIAGPGSKLLTIDGNGSPDVFDIRYGTVDLSGVTITGGNGGRGSGLNIRYSKVTLTDCTVTGNHASFAGGGVYTYESTTTLTDCTISGNFGSGGGGLFNGLDATTTLTNCTISGNSAGIGGGVYLYNGKVTLTGCTISGNSSEGNSGGGLAVGGRLSRLFGYTPIATLTDCTISGNTTTGPGGGVYSFTGGTTTLTNCTISGNTAGVPGFSNGYQPLGGGVYSKSTPACDGTITLTNCTVSGNTASQGGGLYDSGGGTTLGNTIVAVNTAATAGPDAFGVLNSQGHNLIGKTDDSSGWVSSDLTGTVAHPLSPRLGSLADNGGPTKTFALLVGSPAIDVGSNALAAVAGVTTDQRGVSRPYNVIVDIGAFEFTADITVAAGDGQTGPIDTAFAIPLTVTISDPTNHPVSGVTIIFAAPLLGPSATFGGHSTMTAITGADGRATIIAQANDVTGSYRVTASAAGAAGSVFFALTNTPFGLPTISGASSIRAGDSYDLMLDPTLKLQDPTLSVRTWHIDFGDGTPIVNAAGTATDKRHTFSDAPNNLTITATATLSNGSIVPAGTTVLVDVRTRLLTASATTHASGGDQVTLVIPGDVNLRATLTVAPRETRALTFFIGTYSGDPAPVAINGAAFFEIRVSDTLTGQPLGTIPNGVFVDASFRTQPVPPDDQLLYFDPAQNFYIATQSGPLPPGVPVSDPAQGLFNIRIDRDSLPPVTELGGTVFTVALPPVRSDPPPEQHPPPPADKPPPTDVPGQPAPTGGQPPSTGGQPSTGGPSPPAVSISAPISAAPIQVQPTSAASASTSLDEAGLDIAILAAGSNGGYGSGSRAVFVVNAGAESSTTARAAQGLQFANNASGGTGTNGEATRGEGLAGDNRSVGEKAADTVFEMMQNVQTITGVIYGTFIKPFGFEKGAALPPPITAAFVKADEPNDLNNAAHEFVEWQQPLLTAFLASEQLKDAPTSETAEVDASVWSIPRAAAALGLLGWSAPVLQPRSRGERRPAPPSRRARPFVA